MELPLTPPASVPVLIVGAGGGRVTIANLLGTYGVRALVIDRSPSVLDYPAPWGWTTRPAHLPGRGPGDAMLRDMIQNVPMRMYTGSRQCFAEILPSTREFGWFRRNLFSQPLGEATLRKAWSAFRRGAAPGPGTARPGAGRHRRHRHAARCAGRRDLGARQLRGGLRRRPQPGARAHPQAALRGPHPPGQVGGHRMRRRPSGRALYRAALRAAKAPCLPAPALWPAALGIHALPGEDGEQMLAPDKVCELLRSHVAEPKSST